MNKKCSVVVLLFVWGAFSFGSGQAHAQPETPPTSDDMADALRGNPDWPTMFFPLEHASAIYVKEVIAELGLYRTALISASNQPNQIIVRGPTKAIDDIARLIQTLEEAGRAAKPPKRQSMQLSFKLVVPTASDIKWTGGQGGITTKSLGGMGSKETVGSFAVPGSNTFRITNCYGYERLIVQARIEITTSVDQETGAVMQSNLSLNIASPADLEELSQGREVYKYITGPHSLSAKHPQLFGEIVKSEKKTAAEVSREVEGAAVVAVVHLIGVRAQDDATFFNNDKSGAESTLTDLKSMDVSDPAKLGKDETNVTSLTKQFGGLENKVLTLAQQLRKLSGTPSDEATKLRNELAKSVAESFAVRQKLQQAQIELQRAKLDALESRVAGRASTSEQIIQQRINELVGNAPPLPPLTTRTASAIEAAQSVEGDVSITVQPKIDLMTIRGEKLGDVESVLKKVDEAKSSNRKPK